MIPAVCPVCSKQFTIATGAYNRACQRGYEPRCSRACDGIMRRKHKTPEQKKAEKAEYDREYREKNRAMLKAKKAERFQRTYDPAKAAVERKKRAHKHAEYCRRPEYRAWKREYDKQYRANREYGDYAEAFLTLRDLENEILSNATRVEIGVQNGTLCKSQKRKRAFAKSQRPEPEVGPVGDAPIGPAGGYGCGAS